MLRSSCMAAPPPPRHRPRASSYGTRGGGEEFPAQSPAFAAHRPSADRAPNLTQFTAAAPESHRLSPSSSYPVTDLFTPSGQYPQPRQTGHRSPAAYHVTEAALW